jgi:hypothetical protein
MGGLGGTVQALNRLVAVFDKPLKHTSNSSAIRWLLSSVVQSQSI